MGTSDAESTGGECRREYFRVLTRLPVRYRQLRGSEASLIGDEILGRKAKESARMDPQLLAWFDRIEGKLDRILEHLGMPDAARFSAMDVQDVSLSGSGILFTAKDRLIDDSTALVEFQLPGPPARPVRCLARVVRSMPLEDAEGQFATAVRFDVISEDDRDEIIRHVVEVERNQLRARAAGARGE